MDILSFALGYKKGKSTGGGGGTSGDERVKYVTFMRGEEELLKYPVISGDTCRNPVSKGLIDTPTKEQTVSTVYTYSGWSLTDGGAASSSALQNVTEDRTVYAAFAESVRTYTINFYDGETLLTSKQVAYGTKPSYTPTKEGYVFMGWSPEITEVTCDTDYIAIFEEASDFANGSWEYISRVSKAGSAATVFKEGDTRKETLTWSDGTTEEITFTIGAIYDADTEDGTPVITIVPTGLISKQSKYHTKNGESYNPLQYTDTVLHTFLMETVKPALPANLQSVMQTAWCRSNVLGTKTRLPICSLCYCDLGQQNCGTPKLYGFGTGNNSDQIRRYADGTAGYWWLGDRGIDSITKPLQVNTNGQITTSNGANLTGVGVMFKIFV